jgi:phage tail-like protein
MANITAQTTVFEPYKNFKFRVKWDNTYVAAVTQVSALSRTTQVIEFREGGDPSSSKVSPGQTKYDAVTIERGVSYDSTFQEWADKVWQLHSKDELSLQSFRKDIIIEMYNEANQLALSFNLYRCWVSEYQAAPELDASGNAVAIERIKIENEGWERIVPSTPASGA